MPLSFAVPDNGQVGVALRRQRGVHNTLGTGACRRLASLLPIEVSVSADTDTEYALGAYDEILDWKVGRRDVVHKKWCW